jgi:hypothetical protein
MSYGSTQGHSLGYWLLRRPYCHVEMNSNENVIMLVTQMVLGINISFLKTEILRKEELSTQ